MLHYALVDPSGVTVIVLPKPTRTLNVLLNQHRWARTADKREWDKLLAEVVAKREPKQQRMWIEIDRYASRVADNDNLAGGAKPLMDAIRRHGLIYDDSPQWIEAHYAQHKSTRLEAHTVVRLKEIYE